MQTTPEVRSPEAFSQRLRPHLNQLFRSARRIVQSDDLAWDAVQETLIRLWADGVVSETSRNSLQHLVRLSSLHQLRCQRRRRYHEAEASIEGEPCCDDDPLAAMDREERLQAVREALLHLPKDYRSVFELFTFEGASYQAIAEQLNVPVGTVRSRLSRTRAMLQDRLPGG